MRLLRLLVPFFCLLSLHSDAQKVGVVLSGGGANGLAHIGVLKALEENQIPIDYITGTSIGAFVGALYATGYSPDQIEALFSSQDFQNQAKGIVDDRYIYYFKQREPNASWITVKFNPESILESLPPTNLISPEPIDLGLLELLAAPSAAAGYDFDSLFIPFRCVAADITLKKDKVFSEGSLNKAVRASIAYPFYLKPVIIDSSFYVDGGLYNNFPADVMYNEFLPDIIIGSNVAGPVSHPEEDNLLSQIRGMLVTITDYDTQCENGIMIEPITDVGLFEFEEPSGTIQVGYEAALKSIPEIQERIHRRTTVSDLTNARAKYRSTLPALNFHAISIDGLNRKQSIYVQKLVTERRKSLISMADFKKNYFRLISDNKLKNIYPDAVYDPILKSFELKLDIKKERRITAEFGGVVSNKPINQGYLGVEYHYLGRTAVSLMANTYFGKLYSSADVKGRLDFPSRLPYYLEGGATLNRWDFYKSNSLLLIDENPAYLVQNDKYAYAAVGLPISNKGLLNVGYRYAQVRNHYYQTLLFSANDTTDRTDLNFVSGHVRYTRSSLNRKQYASDGTYVNVIARYVHGEEYSRPGSTARDQRPFRGIHEWSQIKGTFDSYFMQTGTFKFGLYLEGAYSTQPLFRNYTSSLLASPAFMPTPESTTLFLTQFRAFKYGAAGGKAIVSMLNSKLDLRLEGYVFQPYQAIRKGTDHSALLGPAFNERYYLGSSTLVYHSPLGPIAVSGNYYPSSPKPFSFLFHIGYILFNRRAMD